MRGLALAYKGPLVVVNPRLNLLAGLEQADQGQLEWQGACAQAWSLARLAVARRSLIGFVFQAYYLCSLSV